MSFTAISFRKLLAASRENPAQRGVMFCSSGASREFLWRTWKQWEEVDGLHDNKTYTTRFSNRSTVEFRWHEKLLGLGTDGIAVIDAIDQPVKDYWKEFFAEHFPKSIYSPATKAAPADVVIECWSEQDLQHLQRLLFDRHVSFLTFTSEENDVALVAGRFYNDLGIEFAGWSFYGLDGFTARFRFCTRFGGAAEHVPVTIYLDAPSIKDRMAFRESLVISAQRDGVPPLHVFVRTRGMWGL